MADTGWVLPTASADSSAATEDWTNIANVETDDTSAATGTVGGLAYGFLYTFGFAGAGLESGDTVTDVEVRCRAYDNYDGAGWAMAFEWDDTASDVAADYTGDVTRLPVSGDFPVTTNIRETRDISLVGTQPTATELLDSDFRLMMYHIDIDSYPEDAQIETVWMRVTYTAAGGGSIVTPVQGSNLGTDLFNGTLT